ncbi:DUF4062 domain-containing protein [Pedobacter cryoconitis]|uniref:DUF4062 domain-containing protein n=1 Tax=Pedobacter cryoconitis TaxID=188932 RepID=UPI00161A10E3|nr:DUF4062 domain-containing protein [Pedobacter cryoconitis]MBB5643979.1 hypothetical protein [Pedobacter cryoconitis]
MAKRKKEKIKIMVSSTVYHFKSDLEQLCSTLIGFGYEVICSHIGTVYPVPGKTPEESCLVAVAECDFFFGIIFPMYGSGITHKEFQEAVRLNKPRGFLAHHDVAFAKQLLKEFMFEENGDRNGFKLTKRTPVMDDLLVIDMYNIAIGDGLPKEQRLWAQEFHKYPLDGAPFVNSLFGNEARFRADLEKLKGSE